MKSTTFALASLLASAALAQPHRHQQLHKREADVKWVTQWDYVTETVDVTETIWVSSGFVPPTSSSKVSASTTSSSSSSSSTAEVPGQFFQGESSSTSSSVYVAPTPSTTSVYVAPAPSSTYIAPAPSSSESAAAVYVAPVESSTTSAAAVATTAATDSSSSSSYGATTSGCKSGSPCTGDITFYTAGLGACGTTTDGSVDKVVALPHGLMGTESNGNPYCGQTITIKCSATGKTTTATVVDKCMGCEGMSIDLSNAAFDELDDESVGRTTAEWWFN